jgi:hypothetical protein
MDKKGMGRMNVKMLYTAMDSNSLWEAQGMNALGRPRQRWERVLKCISEKYDEVILAAFISLSIGTNTALL